MLFLVSLILASIACESESSPTRIVQGFTPSPPTIPTDTTTDITAPLQETYTPTPQPTETTTPLSYGNATVIAANCNLRSGPGKNYAVVGNAKQGDVFPVFGKDETGEWIQVDWEKQVWISASLLKLDIEKSNLPVIVASSPSVTSTQALVQEVTQPVGTPTLAPIGTSTVTPIVSNGFIEVFNISTYNSDGDLIIYGEVRNIGDKPVKHAEVSITLYDVNGNLLDTDSATVSAPLEFSAWYFGILYPSEQAPFRIIFDNPGNWKEIRTSIEYEEATESDYSDQYKDLRVIHDTGRAINEWLFNYKVSGEIENIGDITCGPVRIVVTLYNNKGQIVGMEETGMTDVERLNPGETAPFTVEVYARGPVAYYRIIVAAIKH